MSEKKAVFCRECEHFLKRRCKHPDELAEQVRLSSKAKVVSGKRGLCFHMTGMTYKEQVKRQYIEKIKQAMKDKEIKTEDLE